MKLKHVLLLFQAIIIEQQQKTFIPGVIKNLRYEIFLKYNYPKSNITIQLFYKFFWYISTLREIFFVQIN